jgi:hypothetical protein
MSLSARLHVMAHDLLRNLENIMSISILKHWQGLTAFPLVNASSDAFADWNVALLPFFVRKWFVQYASGVALLTSSPVHYSPQLSHTAF